MAEIINVPCEQCLELQTTETWKAIRQLAPDADPLKVLKSAHHKANHDG